MYTYLSLIFFACFCVCWVAKIIRHHGTSSSILSLISLVHAVEVTHFCTDLSKFTFRSTGAVCASYLEQVPWCSSFKTSLIRDEHGGNGRLHGYHFQIVTAFLRLHKSKARGQNVCIFTKWHSVAVYPKLPSLSSNRSMYESFMFYTSREVFWIDFICFIHHREQ